MDDLKEGKYALSKISSTFIVTSSNEDKANERAEKLKKVLGNYGLNCCVEDLNTMQAFLSAIPGSIHQNPRQSIFASNALIERLLPLCNPWKGSSTEDCLFVAKGRD